MAPSLPSSLSPHICILPSPDLQELLLNASLPPLSQILQSFTPLSQVTTRTTTLTSVPHATLTLRFSELTDVESAVHEDEEQRAGRTMDWIGARVSSRAAKWVEMMESPAGREDSSWRNRTPWWEEVKRCVEGDIVPNRLEGWNHPVAVVYAISTMAPNPLQALHDLHTRPSDLPPWVDNTQLRYSLIIHPSNSPLEDPIAESLFNAVKKQYGLHSYLLPLALPTSPLPPPVTVPLPAPRLPSLSSMTYSPMPQTQVPIAVRTSTPTPNPLDPGSTPTNGSQNIEQPPPVPPSNPGLLYLSESDIQQTSRFVRQFAVMSLLPWMEKCVVDWNEIYSSSRRLPSRLFSSTKRLFGSSYASTSTNTAPSTPTHGSNPSLSSVASRFVSHAPNSSVSSLASISSASGAVSGLVTQQRRLAEFATILGDYKVAINVWDTLRKDSKGGSDILPLLSAPSLALGLHASNAIAALSALAVEDPAFAQMRALVCAVRWDVGIDPRDFLGNILEGDRWLVQAAGAAEEPPTALLLGHAAFLSVRRNARRRAALWYLFAADKLEKAGLKPIALHFFRQSQQLYMTPLDKGLSPAFWEGEDRTPSDWRGFEAVLPGIEHELGRLLYTTGDTRGAVKYFLGLLRSSSSRPPETLAGLGLSDGELPQNGRLPPTDRVYIEDFRVALKHFRDTEQEGWAAAELQLPVRFSLAKQTRIRLPGDAIEGDPATWRAVEAKWAEFWKARGKETLAEGGKAAVNEPFWVDLAFYNPLNVEVTISRLSAVVEVENRADDLPLDFVQAEVVDEVTLGARETRTIPIAVKCAGPASLIITHVTFDFLSLLPVTESLAVRGKRLHDTPQQRQTKVYAPDVLLKVDVGDASQRLQAHFVDDRHLVLAQGERRQINALLKNTGKNRIDELWLITQSDDEIWVDLGQGGSPASPATATGPSEVLRSSNSIAASEPFWVPLDEDSGIASLGPGDEVNLPLHLHASLSGEQDLSILLVYREANATSFHSTRLTRHYEVRPIFEITTSSEVGRSAASPFTFNVDIKNLTTSSNILIQQVTTLSPVWSCAPLSEEALGGLSPGQSARIAFSADQWEQRSGAETRNYLAQQLRAVLQDDVVPPVDPPPVDLLCGHATKGQPPRSVNDAATRHFIHGSRRQTVRRACAASFAPIPAASHRFLFPLYNPYAVDVLVFWAIPAQGRGGHVLVTGLALGAGHAPLRALLGEIGGAKLKRNMYAETQRERTGVLEAVRQSEWNAEANPLALVVDDGAIVRHDFSKGVVRIPVAFTLRNLSLTNPSRFKLQFSAHPAGPQNSKTALPASYTGRLTFKGELGPLKSTTIEAKIRVHHPGSYVLNSWTVGAEVGEISEALDSAESPPSWQTRQRYELSPQAGDQSCITVVDISQL